MRQMSIRYRPFHWAWKRLTDNHSYRPKWLNLSSRIPKPSISNWATLMGTGDQIICLSEGPEESDNARYLLVLVREKNGQLKLAARNNTT